jgi:cation diffusion facilitator family transporter
MTDSDRRQSQSMLAVNLGLVANIVLAVAKTLVGVLGNSPALLADGINSTSDVVYYIVVRVFIQMARKPADQAHPFGHSQLESIAAVVVGSFVITTAVAIFWNSINSIFELLTGASAFEGATSLALLVALITIGLKVGLTVLTRRLGKSTGSAAVVALAYDHRNDVFSASAAALGIALGRSGYPWVDPLAGALVALVILRTGIEIIRDSSTDLMDSVPSKTLAAQIKQLVEGIDAAIQVEEVYAHRFGPYFVINMTLGVDSNLSVAQGDAVASEVDRVIRSNLELVRRVHVHYHPARAEFSAGQPRSQADLGV